MNVKLLVLAGLVIQITSCVPYRPLVNFNDENLPFGQLENFDNLTELRIQPDDLLRVTISSFDPEAAEPFNIESGGRQVPQQLSQSVLELFQGYLVQRNGSIDLPVLGSIMVEGLTTNEIKAKVEEQVKTYIRDPVVTVRLLNFKITVLGEVNTPGVVRATNSRLTILEALGFAGDLTDYADRTSVTVIREIDGQRKYAELNLRRNNIFNSEFFYLQQNDVIYIPPMRTRTAVVADPAARFVSYGSGILSIITLIIAITRN